MAEGNGNYKPFNLNLTVSNIERLDEKVKEGRFRSRSHAVDEAIAKLLDSLDGETVAH